MRIIKFIFVVLLFVTFGVANANPNTTKPQETSQCLIDIGNDEDNFVDILKSEILKDREFNQKLVDKEQHKIYNLVAANIVAHCIDVNNIDDFNYDIVDKSNINIPFKMDKKYYRLKIDVTTLFDYINLPVGIMVTNLRDKQIGDVITKNDTSSDYITSSDCSDHWVRGSIDNDGPVNRAGQTSFPSYAGQEFFVDFPFGKNNRAFPGLIVAAKKGIGGAEQVVWYSNYKTGRENAKKFAQALQNTACARDNLVVDVVSLTTVPDTQSNKKGWAIGAGVLGGTMIAAGSLGLAAAEGVAMTGVLATVAGASSSIPVAGWIVAGVALVASAAIAIAPKSLADLQQVMILDGPYRIK